MNTYNIFTANPTCYDIVTGIKSISNEDDTIAKAEAINHFKQTIQFVSNRDLSEEELNKLVDIGRYNIDGNKVLFLQKSI